MSGGSTSQGLVLEDFTSEFCKFKHGGVYQCRADEKIFILTKVSPTYTSNYGKGRIIEFPNEDGTPCQYSLRETSNSMLGGAIVCDIKTIWVKPGSRVLYLAFNCRHTISHLSDLVGPTGMVYVVESFEANFLHLQQLAQERPNILPIFEDARYPSRYGNRLGSLVDVIISEEFRPDKVAILASNARSFLKPGGNFIFFVEATLVYAGAEVPEMIQHEIELRKLKTWSFNVTHWVTLEPFQPKWMCVVGAYLPGENAFGREYMQV